MSVEDVDAVTVELERVCVVADEHDDCWHRFDAEHAVNVLADRGWRPNQAELEAENARLRDAVDRLSLDRDLLRGKLKELERDRAVHRAVR